MWTWSLAAAVLFAAPVSAGADTQKPPVQEQEDNISADRPNFSNGPDTVARGRIQLEGGYTFSRQGGDRTDDWGSLLLRVGTSKRTELRVALGSYTRSVGPDGRTFGSQDASIGTKVNLLEGSDSFSLLEPKISLVVETSLPTGSAAYREAGWQPGGELLASWNVTKRFSVSTEAACAWASQGGKRFTQWSGGVVGQYALTERIAASAELFSFLPGGYAGPSTNWIDGGLTYLVNRNFQLDINGGMAMAQPQPNYFVGGGFAHRW